MRKIGHKVILEGIDGAGKSTLADRIKRLYPEMDYKIIHCTRNTPNNYKFFRDFLLSEDNIIFDRFHVGQWIYQTYDERDNKGWMTLVDLGSLEDIIKDNDFEVIYIHSDLDKCLMNCKKDSEDSYYTIDYLKDLDFRYRFFFEHISSIDTQYYYNEYKIEDTRKMSSDERSEVAREFDYSSLPYVYAVDFDGVLATDCFPNIENAKPNLDLIDDLKKRRSKGDKVVLWTCRTDNSLIEACNFCADYGLYFDAINDNIKEVKDKLDGGPRKIWASVYIDDKAKFLKYE